MDKVVITITSIVLGIFLGILMHAVLFQAMLQVFRVRIRPADREPDKIDVIEVGTGLVFSVLAGILLVLRILGC